MLGNILFNATTGAIMMLFVTLAYLCDHGNPMEMLVVTWKLCIWRSLISSVPGSA